MSPTAARTLRSVAATLAALWVLAIAALPVTAAEPPELHGPLTDIAERLVGEEDAVHAALDDLRARRGIALYVVTMDGIDGEEPAIFADAIAAANDLGPTDAVLFVSFGDRQFGMWTGRDLEVGPELIDELLVVLGDDLRAGQVADGMTRAAANLERLVDGQPIEGGGSIPEPTEPIETAPVETFPEEPVPPYEEEPVDPVTPGQPVDLAPVVLAVGLIGAAVAGGAGGIAFRRRRTAIAGLETTADWFATRAATAAKSGTDAVDALAFEYGEAVAAPFREGSATAEIALARVRSGRSRLAEVRGLGLDPRQAIVTELEGVIEPLETWSRAVAQERSALGDLASAADERTAEVADALAELGERQVAATARIAALAAISPSAHASVAAVPARSGDLLARLEDRARQAAAALAAGRRPAGVLALREALRDRDELRSQLASVDELGNRVDRAVAERATATEEAAGAITQASAALEASPVAHLTSRLAEARRLHATAGSEADVLIAWDAARQATHDAGAITAEVEAVRRAASEALDLASTRLTEARDYIDHHRDVSGGTADLLAELGRRLQSLLGALPEAPLELRDAARSIADSIDAVRSQAQQEVASAQAERDRRNRSAFAASSSASSFSSSSDSSSSSSSSSGSGSSGSSSGHGGGSSSGGTW